MYERSEDDGLDMERLQIEQMLEDDEITPAEAGFMLGVLRAGRR